MNRGDFQKEVVAKCSGADPISFAGRMQSFRPAGVEIAPFLPMLSWSCCNAQINFRQRIKPGNRIGRFRRRVSLQQRRTAVNFTRPMKKCRFCK
jgi:hypothetical protein